MSESNLVSKEEGLALLVKDANKRAPEKWHNIRVEIDGKKFQSKKEARYYGQLVLQKKMNMIQDFACQVRFPLLMNGEKLTTYIADFVVKEKDGSKKVIDVKGSRDRKSPVYRLFLLKKKLMKHLVNVEVEEV